MLAVFWISEAAAGVTIRCSTDRDSLTLGDRIQFVVSLTVPKGAVVAAPETERGFGSFIVKEWNSTKTELASADSIVFRYIVTTYTMKACSIPSLEFIVTHGEERDTVLTEPLAMKIFSVVTGDTVDIKDLKPQQRAGRPSLAWLWITLFLLLVGGGLLWWHRRLRKPPPPPPPLPPYEEAIEALNRLEALNYVKLGKIREYVFGLSEILKRYLERRYCFRAAEYTTEEILEWLKNSPLLREDKRRAEWFFCNTDPVKFAKYIPDDETLLRFGVEVRAFLDATRPAAMAGEVDRSSTQQSGAQQDRDQTKM